MNQPHLSAVLEIVGEILFNLLSPTETSGTDDIPFCLLFLKVKKIYVFTSHFSDHSHENQALFF